MKTIAFYGTSTTAGKGQSFDIVSYLQKQNKNYEFKNFGTGGDTAFNALQRIDDVVDAKPDITFIMIGENDVLVNIFPKLKKMLSRMKSSYQQPDLNLYESNMRTIVQTLKAKTNSKIVLCSLELIGENLVNPSITQQQINDSIKSHSSIVKQIANEEMIDYLPFYENFYNVILENSHKNLDEINILPMYRDAFRSFILRWSPDKIGERNGWKFHSDGIHMNSKGAMIFINLVENYLKSIHI